MIEPLEIEGGKGWPLALGEKINELVDAYNDLLKKSQAQPNPVKVHSFTFTKCACGKCTQNVEKNAYTYPWCPECYEFCGT